MKPEPFFPEDCSDSLSSPLFLEQKLKKLLTIPTTPATIRYILIRIFFLKKCKEINQSINKLNWMNKKFQKY